MAAAWYSMHMFNIRKKGIVQTDETKIQDILNRSVAEILPSRGELATLLRSGKRLRVYVGADATGPHLHLGHATNFIVLEKSL